MKNTSYEYIDKIFSAKQSCSDIECERLIDEEVVRIDEIINQWNNKHNDKVIERLFIPEGIILVSAILETHMRAYASKSEHEYIVFEYHKINCLMEVFKREFDDGSVKEGTLYSHDLFYALIGYNVCLVSYLVWLMCDDDSFSMESDYTPIVDKYFIPIQKRYMKTIKIRPIEQN